MTRLNDKEKNRAYIGIGSNQADPYVQVKKALYILGHTPHITVLRHSSLYLSPPYGQIPQPDFINAVAEIETGLAPLPLLEQLKDLEKAFGRDLNAPRWGPRIIDFDILYYNDLILDHPKLTLPHPEIGKRWFVLLPLLELGAFKRR